MSSHTPEKLAYMANQIARNLAHEPDPAAAVARHIHDFWSPRMIAQALALGGSGLDPAAREALAHLTAGTAAG